GVAQGGERLVKMLRVAAQFGGAAAALVVAAQDGAGFVELPAEAGVVAELEGLLVSEDGGPEGAVAQGGVTLLAAAGAVRGLVVGAGGDQRVGLEPEPG